jgi:hypothetical protein
MLNNNIWPLHANMMKSSHNLYSSVDWLVHPSICTTDPIEDMSYTLTSVMHYTTPTITWTAEKYFMQHTVKVMNMFWIPISYPDLTSPNHKKWDLLVRKEHCEDQKLLCDMTWQQIPIKLCTLIKQFGLKSVTSTYIPWNRLQYFENLSTLNKFSLKLQFLCNITRD